DGLLRLHFSRATVRPPIWDTCDPPKLEHCNFYGTPRQSWQRFRTVDLSKARGITFFYINGYLYGIHIHLPTHPCALSTFERLSERSQSGSVWIYLPISQSDAILAFGTRETEGAISMLVRTRLSGEIIVGPQEYPSAVDQMHGICGSVLMYSEPLDNRRIDLIGAFCPGQLVSQRPVPFAGLQPRQQDTRSLVYFSSAPVAKVTSIHVFRQFGCLLCQGILFKYENGGQRAIGQCRIGDDKSNKCAQPLMVCINAASYETDGWGRMVEGVQVGFQ
ncbi:hypothetical protein F5883DRAFT_357265, partial [Diaporthe sp. PMI_573]